MYDVKINTLEDLLSLALSTDRDCQFAPDGDRLTTILSRPNHVTHYVESV